MQLAQSAATMGNRLAVSMKENRFAKWSMYVLMMFPIIDFGLRYTVHAVHPLGVIWDKIVFVVLLVLTIIRYMGGYRPPRYRWHMFATWFILFGLGLAIAGLGHPVVAFQGYRDDVYYLLFAFLIPFIISSEDVMPLFHIGASVAILVAIHAIYQYITKAPYPASWNDVPGAVTRSRVYSVFASSNELAPYMALMTPLLAGLAIYTEHRIRRWIYGIGSFLCLVALMFTYTRGAWLALGMSLFLMSVLFERRLLIILVVVGIAAAFLPPIQHRFAEFFSPVYWIKSAQGGRVERWLQALQTMSNQPLVGAGMGKYGGAVAAIYSNGIYSDNYYSKIIGEMGLTGIVLFLTMHVGLMRDIYKHALRPLKGRARYLVLGGMAGLLAVLIHNFTENVFEFPANMITYFLYATLLLTFGKGFNKEGQHESTSAREN